MIGEGGELLSPQKPVESQTLPSAKPEAVAPEVDPWTAWKGLKEKQLFSEEAPTKKGRDYALRCLAELTDFVAARQAEKKPSTTNDLKQTYEAWKEERKGWGQEYQDVTLTHVFGGTKRRIKWFSDLKKWEKTDTFDKDLRKFFNILNLLGQIIKPITPGRIEAPKK